MIAATRRAPDGSARVDFDCARELMLAATVPLPAELVALATAHERVVTLSYHAQADIVPYVRSGMDGFAVRSAETAGAQQRPVALPIRGLLYAGDDPPPLALGCAAAIATGAALPSGADAVVPIERVVVAGGSIILHAALAPGEHVFDAGDDAKRGDVLVAAGRTLTPGRAALLAAAGYPAVRVHRRPRVSILCTGDEVVAVTAEPGPGKVRNSNAAMLAAQLARDGAELVASRTVGDDRASVRTALRDALAGSDLVITTGGASVGERDFVKSTLAGLGTRFAFRSVALRPAKPTAFGRCGDTLVAVLPGNPAAAFVAYATLVRGVVRRLAGHADAFSAPITALLDGSLHAKAERHFVLFGDLAYRDHAFAVAPLANQCSSLVRTSADANALIVIPPGGRTYAPGDRVEVDVLDWSAVRFAR